MSVQKKQPHDVYTLVTDIIVAQLEKGIIPWKKTWQEAGIPRNLVTNVAYRGINVWLLSALNYQKNFFLTWHQLKKIGGSIHKGEFGHVVVFWKLLEKKHDSEDDTQKKAILRYHKVFNVAQCYNLPLGLLQRLDEVDKEKNTIESCEDIVSLMPQRPTISHKGDKAYYDPKQDYVNVPTLHCFVDAESYYNVLFHELVHATGHSSRLNRKELVEPVVFGSLLYSIEELTAEIGASYLQSIAGVSSQKHIENNVAYIQGWLKQLRNDKRFIIYASSQAQRATDFILNVSYDSKPE